MKYRLFKLAALTAGISLMAASCEKPAVQPDPEFPAEKLQRTVLAGESVDIAFTANLDWELEAEGEGVLTYFWIDDNGSKASKVKGTAGEQVVTVKFSEEEELDNNRTCVVKLTMGGETRDIAQIDRLMINRTLVVKVAEAFETAFRKVDGKFVYNDILEGQELSFISFPEEVEYTLPVKVQTNFDWNISVPEWVECSVNEGVAGDTELVLSAKLSAENAKGAVAEIKLVDADNTEAFETFEVKLGAFADRVEFSITATEFNAEGQVKSPMGEEYYDGVAYLKILAAEGFAVKALGFGGQWHDGAFADWVNAQQMNVDGEGYLKNYTFSISVNANTSTDQRLADILVLPASKSGLTPDLLCDSASDICAFLPEIQPYCAGRISQLGKSGSSTGDTGVLSLDPDYDNYMASLTATPDSWLKYDYENAAIFSLVYNHERSDAQIIADRKIASVKLLNYDLQDAGENFWADTWFRDNMFRLNVDMSSYSPVSVDEAIPECFVLFIDENGDTFAVIDFTYNEGQSTDPSAAMVTLVDGTAEKMSESNDLYGFFSSEYGTKEIYEATVSAANPVIKLAQAPASIKTYLLDMASGSTPEDTENIYLEGGMDNTFTVYISKSVTSKTQWFIVFKDANNLNYALLLLTYDPSSAAAPFSFAYPDYVSGATLSKYSGTLLNAILGEHYGLSSDNVYELRYSGEPSMALLNVPGEPFGEAAWNNYPVSADYWLTYEMEGTSQMYVNMTKKGESDWFLWNDSMGMPSCVLVCTAE